MDITNIESILNYVIIGSWVFVGFFVLINILLGFKRGTKKTLYYTITSLISIILIMIGLSFLTIKWFIPTPGDLVKVLEGFGLKSDNQLMQLVYDPSTSPVVFAVIDIVLKIVVFIVLFPILRLLLNLIIFKPIYKKHFKVEPSKIDVILKRKPKKESGVSRLGGSLIGALKGLMVAYILIIPFIILVGSTSGINIASNDTNNLKLSTESNEESSNQILDILEYSKKLNDKTIAGASKKIMIGTKSLDEKIFDFAFSGKIKHADGTKDKLEVAFELRNAGDIVNELVKLGVLDGKFDVQSLNHEEHYENIDAVFDKLGNSNLLNIAFPVALEYGAANVDLLKAMDIKNNANTSTAYNHLKKINWSKEMATFNSLANSVLKVGSVKELMDIVNNPSLILSLSKEEQLLVADVITNISKLNILYGLNIGVEYLVHNKVLPEVNNGEDYKEYYDNALKFLYDNPSFLINDDGEINKIAKLVKDLVNDNIPKEIYDKYVLENGKLDTNMFLDENLSGAYSKVLQFIGDFDLITKAIPIGVDVVLYGKGSENSSEELNDKISNIVKDIDFKEEFNGFDKVYAEVLKLAILENTSGSANLLNRIDNVLLADGNMATVKKIVNEIFINSKFVSSSLNLASEVVVDRFIKEGDVKTFAKELITNEDFSMGKEIVGLVELIENIYKHTSLSSLNSSFIRKDYLELMYEFADLSDEEFEELTNSLFDLQTIKFESANAIKLLASTLKVKNVVVNDEVTSEEATHDLKVILNAGFSIVKTMKSNDVTINNYKNLPINQFIDKDKMIEILHFDNELRPNSILAQTLVNVLKKINVNAGEVLSIKTPEILLDKDASSIEWNKELNVLVGSLLNAFASSTTTLTYNDITKVGSASTSKKLALFTEITDALNEKDIDPVTNEDNLDRFVSSLIIKETFDSLVKNDGFEDVLNKELSKITNTEVTSFSTKPELDQLDENGVIKNIEIKNMLLAIGYLNLGDESGSSVGFNTFYNMLDNNRFDDFMASNYLRVILSRILTNKDILNYMELKIEIEKDSLTLNETIKDANGNLVTEEIKNILIATRELGISSFEDFNLDLTKLSDLVEDNKLDNVLNSNYIYQVIDLVLKKNLTNIPAQALSSTHPGYVSKEEIRELLVTFKNLELGNLNEISSESLTIENLGKLISQESILIRSLLSKELVGVLEVPEASFEGPLSDNLIYKDELINLLEAINILEPDNSKLVTSIDYNNLEITVLELEEIVMINDANGGSPIINRLISNATIKVFNDIPEAAFTDESHKDLTRPEIKKLVTIYQTLGITVVGDPIDTDAMDANKLVELAEIDSIILNNKMSIEIENSLENVIIIPNNAKVDNIETNDITQGEMVNLFTALVKADLNINGLENLNIQLFEVNKVNEASKVESLIFRRIVSKSLINNSKTTENPDNVLVIAEEFILNDNNDVKGEQVMKLFDNLLTLGFNQLDDLITVLSNPEVTELTRIYLELKTIQEENISQILIDTFEEAIQNLNN